MTCSGPWTAIDRLSGRYLTAEDVGTTQSDMDLIATVTPYVTGTSGGSGDPSPMTAFGVVQAMGAVLEELDGDAALAGKRVVVDGVGHVGTHLARLLAEAGARVAVADVHRERADAGAGDRSRAAPGRAGAGGGVRHPGALRSAACSTRRRSRSCSAGRCGAANNQLAEATDGDALAEREILYASDFVVNAGGSSTSPRSSSLTA
jgi:leucine dehydrogenase